MKRFPPFVAALVALLAAASAWGLPKYEIVPLGLDDAEHTRNDGYESSEAYELNEAGQVLGYSERYNVGSTDMGRSVWLYDGTTTLDIGLTGAEHTRNDGYKYSGDHQLNEAGQVSGYSNRYNGGSTDLGRSVWLYNGTTIDVGLTGAEHTRNNGYKYSEGDELNAAGQISGYSYRYNGGSTDLGRSTWLYNGTTTIDIGLTGAAHTRHDGYKLSVGGSLNAAGQVNGRSARYDGGIPLGHSAWLYNGTTTLDIGLTGAEHTRNDGYKLSDALLLNEAGRVGGYSKRYNGGSTDLGQSAWLYDGTTTLDIGLTGAEHTRNNGYKHSAGTHLNEAGQISGFSRRFNGGSTDLGSSAWLYDGTTTLDIGLTGAEYTHNNGGKDSEANQLNEAGQVGGYSKRYNGGSTDWGYSAWLYDGTTTLDIGLTGAEHTRNDGYRVSVSDELNAAGQISGYSRRFNGGSTDLGRSVWLYDGTTTINIGLMGAQHTRNDGYRFSDINQLDLNAAGQVSGVSYRYNGGSDYLGQDAWFYDPVLDQTFPLQLSQRSDGYAVSYVNYLGDDGLAVGSYALYHELDNYFLGYRAFYFTVVDGLHDLGSLVDGGLPANGWEFLADVIRANGRGQILGHGKLTSQSGGQMAYLLTPVPEPSTLLLLCLGSLAALWR